MMLIIQRIIIKITVGNIILDNMIRNANIIHNTNNNCINMCNQHNRKMTQMMSDRHTIQQPYCNIKNNNTKQNRKLKQNVAAWCLIGLGALSQSVSQSRDPLTHYPLLF